MLSDVSLIFEPNLNLFAIFQRKLRRLLFWLIILFLILFGLFGVFDFIFSWLFLSDAKQAKNLDIFYLSLLMDMFLFYLWQRSREKIKKIKLPPKGEVIEISQYLDKAVSGSLDRAWLFCFRKDYHFLRPIHLFAAFLNKKEFGRILERLDCSLNEVKRKTKNILALPGFSRGKIPGLGPKPSPELKNIFIEAYLFALNNGQQEINFLDVLWAINRQAGLVQMVFDEFGISSQEIEHVVEWLRIEKEIKQWERAFYWQRFLKPKGKLNRAMTAATTPFLDRVSQDYTYLARKGYFEMVIDREKEIGELFSLFASGQLGVVLVGPAGIGKKAILHKLAYMMVEENVPKFLQDKRLVELDLTSLVGLSGARERGEEYFKRIIFEVNRAGNIILVIEDIDALSGLRCQSGSLDFAEILTSALDNQALFVIGTTTDEGFASKIEGKILGRVLAGLKVGLPSKNLLWQILIGKACAIEKKFKILFSADSVEQAIDLADRYLYGAALPTKAENLLEEAAPLVRAARGAGALVKGDDLVEIVSKKTDIPLGKLRQKEKETLLNLEKLIHQQIINQEEAVKAVASALRRSRVELEERKKPIANFLFIGPTGVGKTELSKALARIYFGSEKRMIRLDMSEYQEKRSLARLIGLRTEQGVDKGYLTEAIKRQPFALLLLDELEKAHPDILNLFLQVMDDGRLTDASGETINLTNIILIATSNAGTQFVQQKIRAGVDYPEIYQALKDKVLLEYFRPEFLNRFDKIVLFKPLSMENVIAIAHLLLEKTKAGLEGKGIAFETEEEAVKELAQMGYDPLYGARPLKRVLQEKIDDVLARLFLEDKVAPRDKIILKQGLIFEVEKAVKI